MTIALWSLASIIGLFGYATVGVATHTVVYNRLPDRDCRNSGTHLRRVHEDREGTKYYSEGTKYCGCRLWSHPAGIFWLPFVVGLAALKTASFLASGPARLGYWLGTRQRLNPAARAAIKSRDERIAELEREVLS